MDRQVLKDMLSPITARLQGVLMIYLFGSQATGSAGAGSDHDLAVLVEPAVDGRRIQAELAHQLSQALQTDRVDVILLNRVPIELAYAVIAEGIILYERDIATRAEYEARVLGLYGDYLPHLRVMREDVLEGADHVRRVRRYRAALGRTERTLGEIAAARRKASD